MDNRKLYEKTIRNMADSLKITVDDFYKAHNTLDNHFKSHPLFMIASNKLALLENISYFTNYQARKNIADLCKSLCTNSGKEVIHFEKIKQVDFGIAIDKKIIGYYISAIEEYMPDLTEIKKAGIDKLVFVVLKNNLIGTRPNTQKYRNYPDKEMIENISLEDFFNSYWPGEYKIFKEYIERFNEDAEVTTGLTIAPIPTSKTLAKKAEKISIEFSTFFFEDCLSKTFTSEEIAKLKILFSSKNLLSNFKTTYNDSFVSSEWYFDLLVSVDGELEQTAIVAGYLKSVEQLLFSLMLSRCNDLCFKLFVKKGDENKDKLIPLSAENKDSLLTMAGNLLTSIDKNYKEKNMLNDVYIDALIGEKVQDFLHKFFKHTRNGYFHKDNIYDFEEIKQIRKEAYCAYFLLASAFKFDITKI